MIIIIKSEDESVKNFGVVAFDETGVKNISFLPIEFFEKFVNKNAQSEIKLMGKDETKISISVPYGNLKNEPIQIEIMGDKIKFLIEKMGE